MRRKPRRRREGSGDEGSRVQGRERRSQSEGPLDTPDQVGQSKVEDLVNGSGRKVLILRMFLKESTSEGSVQGDSNNDKLMVSTKIDGEYKN